MLRAVIFDFDGVVANTERLHLQGFLIALQAHAISISEADYFTRYLGLDDAAGFRKIAADRDLPLDDEALKRLMAEKAAAFRDLVGERIEIFPGVRELLEELRPIYATAIGSGALLSEIQLILGIAGLSDQFDTIVSADQVTHSKPDPETFTTACDRLAAHNAPNLLPSECVVIEDTPGGLAAATAAGMKTIAVTNSFPQDRLQADLTVDSLEPLTLRSIQQLF